MTVAAEQRFPEEILIMWKMDISGAYTQLCFLPEHAPFMAVALSDRDVLFFLAGIFGWTAMPLASDPITRALRFELKFLLRGLAHMYVDDVIGITPLRWLRHDVDATHGLISRLLGPNAVSDKKTCAARVNEALGYSVDLVKGVVSIARKNVLRALYGFMLVREKDLVPYVFVERLASWAVRYAAICRYLRPFTAVIYAALGRSGFNRRASLRIEGELWIVIKLFRALLALTVLRGKQFVRTLRSFCLLSRPAKCTVIQFDASLAGVGVILYECTAEGRSPLGAAAVSLGSLGCWKERRATIHTVFVTGKSYT